MVDINKYIKEVLKYQDSVVIEGLGTFFANYKTAEIKAKKGVIAPPTKHITFDERHKKDNGRLLEFIKNSEDVSDEVIRTAISEFTARTLNKLDAGEHVRIDELGYLYKDKAYKIHFVQDAGENILLDTYGLEEVEWDIANNVKSGTGEIRETNRSSKNRLILLPISILVIIILVFSILISHKIKKSGTSPDPLFGNLFSKESRTSETKTRDRSKKNKILEDIDSLNSKQNALRFEENQYSNYNKFYLIAGSFSIYNNAEKFKRELDAQGYNAEILEVDGKIFRVSMKSFASRNEALQELYRLQALHKDHTLWILNSI